MQLLKRIYLSVLSLAIPLAMSSVARADDITDWNQHMLRAGTVGGTTPLVMSRVAAIVQASVFDAVNGIDRKYAAVHVPPGGPAGASRRAAAVEAAYTALVALYSSQKSTFDARLAVSLTAIASDPHETSAGIASGITFCQTAANGILSWRATDGFTPAPPPFTGETTVGKWRPTPPGFMPGAGPQFAYMTPWVIGSPSQFRPGGPPDLKSARYAADFNETKTMGSISSATRTADETIYAWFWNASTAAYLWNHLADSLIERSDRDEGDDSGRWGERRNSLLENARLLALLDLAMADAAIACWEAKYLYVFWRPVTAIPLADTDGNTATVADPSWMPLFATPAHPEYPSGHSTVSGAAAAVLASFFGEKKHFTMDNDLMIGVIRSFGSFTQALDEVKNARIFAGIHFRSACDDGQATGMQVANYVLDNALLPVH
ncbi:MAG TPA: vanadium-dependent haloperoxidase [Candidatus Polarisedimenticolia bacterium]|nr:vanadium-dependent haloperoxidase [Candidatus Polarisedimenticolia bacterium]